MMWGYYPSWGGMFLIMVLGNVLWIALLSALVWGVIHWLKRGVHGVGLPAGRLPAMEILRQRYARGEIDTVTFARMRECLEGTRTHEMAADFDRRQTSIP